MLNSSRHFSAPRGAFQHLKRLCQGSENNLQIAILQQCVGLLVCKESVERKRTSCIAGAVDALEGQTVRNTMSKLVDRYVGVNDVVHVF